MSMSTLSSAKLYARVALLRRQILLQQLFRRAIASALAVAALIVSAGLGTFALYLAIKLSLGDLGAALVIAAIYLVVAIVLLVFALHEPHSPELDALAEMEAAALEAATADTQGIMQTFNAAGHRLDSLGSNLSLAAGVLSALRKLLASRKS